MSEDTSLTILQIKLYKLQVIRAFSNEQGNGYNYRRIYEL